MELIARYAQEVGRRLPRSQREDVVRELRSSIEDSLEQRTGLPVASVDEDHVVEVLLEFGPPAKVAASYRTGPDYLIGPSLYPGFIKTIKIALAVVAGLIGLSALVDIAGTSGDMGELGRVVARTISDLQSGLLVVLGLVVLVFAVFERQGASGPVASDDWDPRDLPPLARAVDEVDVTGTTVGVVLSGIALLLINLAPEWLQIHVWSGGDQYTMPLLGDTLRGEIPILNLYLILSLGVGIVVLVQGRWRLATRVADAATSTILVIFLSRLWSKADLLLPTEADLLAAGWLTEPASTFSEVVDDVLSPLLWWLLLAVLLGAAFSSIKKILRVIRSVREQNTQLVPL